MKKLLILLTLCSLTMVFANNIISAPLKRISDGDTLVFNYKHQELKCRIYGIDTPEKFSGNKLNKEAQALNISTQEMSKIGKKSTNYAKTTLTVSKPYQIITYGNDK